MKLIEAKICRGCGCLAAKIRAIEKGWGKYYCKTCGLIFISRDQPDEA